ncbi:MAG: hypothetical protein R6U08_04105 [Bacillota bacterium]
MELVERYIYAVTRRLPEKQRGDIERELRSLIEDMLADRTGGDETSETDIEEVLMELGDPAEMADQYRMKKHFLIGPENFALYMLVIKIVLAAVVFGITLALAIGYVVEPPSSIWALIGGYLGSIFNAVLNAFAWVTLIFAIFEYHDVNMAQEVNKKEEKKQWCPADLPKLPLADVSIKPAESIVGLVFAVLAFILINTAEHLIGIYIFSEEAATQIIPLFNHETFRSLLPLLNIPFPQRVKEQKWRKVTGTGWQFINCQFEVPMTDFVRDFDFPKSKKLFRTLESLTPQFVIASLCSIKLGGYLK